jgi:hypothetical protein
VSGDAIHQLRRGNKGSAAHHFKQILNNDERPRTILADFASSATSSGGISPSTSTIEPGSPLLPVRQF